MRCFPIVIITVLILMGCRSTGVQIPDAATPTATAQSPTETPHPTDVPPTDTAVLPTNTPNRPTPTDTPTPTPPAGLDLSGNPDLNYAQVQFVTATQTGENSWRFDVTVRHNDQGWDHYADLWQVEDLQGNVLGERVLLHPHDTEQPFTRSQSGIKIPPQITQVVVRAKCNVHGFGGQAVLVDFTAGSGENFKVTR